MRYSGLFLASLLLLSGCQSVASQDDATTPVAESGSDDPRQFVDMPAQARGYMRQDMLDHLAAMSEIMGAMSAEDWARAAEIAETRMGKSSMGKYRGTGMGPGRFMPLEMRQLGWNMHEAASRFAEVAGTGDGPRAWAALQDVTATCVACHYSYRTR